VSVGNSGVGAGLGLGFAEFSDAGLPAPPPLGGMIRGGLLFELPVSPNSAATAGQAVQFENVKLKVSIDRIFIFFVMADDAGSGYIFVL
jgi:hypothetical protein